MRLYARQKRQSASLIVEKVTSLFHNDFIAGLRMHFDANLICLRSTRNVQRGFFAENLCHLLLKLIHGRIFAEHIIANLCPHHCFSHCRRGFRYGIAAQIYE